MTSAVVFAYHDVGVRCLSVLLAHQVDVKLVVTHRDDPSENVWFGSVARLARLHGIPVSTPDDANSADCVSDVQRIRPDFLFSFYYRSMLKPALLRSAQRGAFNMHGSLLPKYRGRVPVNWAIIHGEHETGATLHEMTEKPDAGRLVDQQAVPILPNDLAVDVFRKVTFAAELVLNRSLPRLINGTAPLVPQVLSDGSYFGGRKPADGRIDVRAGARVIHDLVRAVAPPYPGAFIHAGGHELRILHTWFGGQPAPSGIAPALSASNGKLWLHCTDGRSLQVLAAELDGQPLNAENLLALAGSNKLNLTA